MAAGGGRFGVSGTGIGFAAGACRFLGCSLGRMLCNGDGIEGDTASLFAGGFEIVVDMMMCVDVVQWLQGATG